MKPDVVHVWRGRAVVSMTAIVMAFGGSRSAFAENAYLAVNDPSPDDKFGYGYLNALFVDGK